MTTDEACEVAGRGRLAQRLAMGLLQGLAFATIIQVEKNPSLTAAYRTHLIVGLLLALFVPPILLAGLGHLRRVTLAVWTLSATVLLALLGVYDLWRRADPGSAQMIPSWPLLGFGGLALYIIHHLIEPVDIERTWRASYALRFETAWRHAFQLAVALAFTGVVWLVLTLADGLFGMIGVKVFGQVIHNGWFSAPALSLAFAAAVHQTDVRPALIQGVRTVVLTLLAWLTPLLAGLVALFLITIPLAGVDKLWATKFASPLLLAAAGVMIVLLNTAYQDGRRETPPPIVLRFSVRLGAWLLTPLVLLALWATGLRIAEHGLTPERVVGLAIGVIEAVYAAGYAWAALARSAWMRPLEIVNVVAAVVMVVVILAMLSPLADPARLSVDDQLHRLAMGRTSSEGFDYAFLRFKAERFGKDALARLSSSKDPVIASHAAQAQKALDPYFPQSGRPPTELPVYPSGAVLPPGLTDDLRGMPEFYQCSAQGAGCDFIVLPAKDGGAPHVLFQRPFRLALLVKGADGHWAELGTYTNATCPGVADSLRAGQFEQRLSTTPSLVAAGQTLNLEASGPFVCALTGKDSRAGPTRTNLPPSR